MELPVYSNISSCSVCKAPWCHRRGEPPLQPWQLPLPSRSLEFVEMAKNHNKPPNQLCFAVRPLNTPPSPPHHRGVWAGFGCIMFTPGLSMETLKSMVLVNLLKPPFFPSQ